MSHRVNAKIRLSLQVRIDTPRGAKSFRNRTPALQHEAKMALLEHLSNEKLRTFLGYWEALPAEVDDHFIDTVPTAATFVKQHLSVANPTLQRELECELDILDACPEQPCTKLPNCGHDCRHLFPVARLETRRGKVVRTPWIVKERTGVTAQVVASLEWSTPSTLAAHDGADGHVDGATEAAERGLAVGAGASGSGRSRKPR